MAAMRGRQGKRFETSNEDKLFFPEAGITKGGLIGYYERVAETMLPHVRGRIVTMRRYPNGIEGKSFYQKDVPKHFPDWIRTVEVRKEGGSLRQLVIEEAETLVYLANQACIAIHVWPSRADKPEHPDRLVFDLDPSNDDFGLVVRGARTVREVLDETGLPAYLMTTGSRGLHVVSPLDRAVDFDTARAFAARVAGAVAERDPERFTVEQRKNKRRGRVYVDYMRNAYAQHAIAPYSVRAKPGAPVAVPLSWDELGGGSLTAQKYTVKNLFRRLARKPDPWAGLDGGAASLEKAREKLDELFGAG